MTRLIRRLGAYGAPSVLLLLPLGFSSGLPLLLTFSTLSAWLAAEHVSRSAIGAFALVGLPYALKFLWAPIIDRAPPPLALGRRRGWGVAIQLALIVAVIALGRCDPRQDLRATALLALLVAFLSASQDVVIDAWRVEILTPEQQGPGAGMIQSGYRIGMLVAGAGALLIAQHSGWFIAYATMAALLMIGLVTFLIAPEPPPPRAPRSAESGWRAMRGWFATAVAGPLLDFTRHRRWAGILVFVLTYKLGEALAGIMAMPLYISLNYSLAEIAAISKFAGFFATIVGALVGGWLTARWGIFRALLICGLLQSAGNLFYVLQAVGGHRLDYLALCVTAENVTGAMAGAAFVAYLSELCSPAFTATQYALLSSLAVVGRTGIGSTAGVLADHLGWTRFFLLSTVATLPALLLLALIARSDALEVRRGSPATDLA
jgi:MFS transporter, PAT family, beta-lactamase induction signal transducer AmpG